MKNTISKKQLREFGLLTGFGFPLIIGWLIPAMYGHIFSFWTLWLGLIFLFLGTIKPTTLYYPYKVWMKMGLILGWINSRLILGLIFLFVLQPIAIIMKLFGHNPLKTKFTNQKSYREMNQDHKIDLTRIF